MTIFIAFAIYAAQPWGDNYAYQDISGYFGLFIFLGWIVSPFVYQFLAPDLFKRKEGTIYARLFFSIVFFSFSTWVYVTSIFFDIDAQGALVFLFIPIYNWILLAVLEVIFLFYKETNLKQPNNRI